MLSIRSDATGGSRKVRNNPLPVLNNSLKADRGYSIFQRSREEMLREDHRLDNLQHRTTTSIPRYPHAPSDSLNRNFPPPTLRFPGDGFDHRRPIMSQPRSNLIDLTLDLDEDSNLSSRPIPPPRRRGTPLPSPFRDDHEIISIDDGDDDDFDDVDDGRINRGHGRHTEEELGGFEEIEDPGSDIELLFSRPRSSVQGRTAHNERPLPPGFREHSRARARSRGSAARIVGDIQDGPARPVPRAPTDALSNFIQRIPQMFMGPHRNFAQQMRMNMPPFGVHFDDDFEELRIPDFNQPDLNFEAVAFDLGQNNQSRQPPVRPTYQAPTPAAEGFTRSPAEDDVLICPNCDCELGQGDDVKREVWVIRNCGHVRP